MDNNILPSWNDTPIKKSIIDFVERVTKEDSKEFISPGDRIAVFDNDGTLWTEQPLQIQVLYSLDRIEELAEKNPQLRETQPFKAFLEKDIKKISTFTKKELMTFVVTTHDGRTPADFIESVKEWFYKTAHPKFKIPLSGCVYKPQIELLNYLRSNGFKTFIVSGGGVNFMRTVAEIIYGIPTEQVIGTSGKTKVEYKGTSPEVVRLPELQCFDDREEKVNSISFHIGKRPVFVFGNSDGDLAMMRYAINGEGASMAMLLHHDDNEREVAYDRDFKLSPLQEALDVAEKEGIKVVSMKKDWGKVF